MIITLLIGIALLVTVVGLVRSIGGVVTALTDAQDIEDDDMGDDP